MPSEMQGRFCINLLEFIVAAITIQLTLQSSPRPLAYTDNSSGIGWLYKGSFKQCQPTYDKVARWLADKLIEHDAELYSQHIQGSSNILADMLSQDFYIDDEKLLLTFLALFSRQTPQNLKIYPLLREIASWLLSLAMFSTKKQDAPSPLARSSLGV